MLQAEKEAEERLAGAEERAQDRLAEARDAAERHRRSSQQQAERELREALESARRQANEAAQERVERELGRWRRLTEAAAEHTADAVAEVVAWVCAGPPEGGS